MTHTGVSRRHFVTLLGTALSAGACSSIRVPRFDDGAPRLPVKTIFKMIPAPIKGDAAKFAIAEINGAPTVKRIEMARALKREAAERKLNLVPDGDPSATYLIKGYLSAITDSTRGSLVFVWDVTDTSGKRLHRITGREPTGGGSFDPWSKISTSELNGAAQRTIDDLADWIN